MFFFFFTQIDHHHQLPSGLVYGNASVSKQITDLSSVNTETKTFVRSSALDILAAFPEPETILSVDRTSRRARIPRVAGDKARSSAMKGGYQDNENMNGASEDICENEESVGSPLDNTGPSAVSRQSVPVSNEHQGDASNYKKPDVRITSWSSTSDIGTKKKGPKKTRLLYKGKKKAKYEISENSGKQQLNENSTASVPNLANTKSKKAKKSNSSALMSFFRGKSESKEESLKSGKRKKERKAVQKSQSFQNSESTPTAKNTQLNRMDSIRRLFKRPRDLNIPSTICVDSKTTENKTCLEISPPILKTGFHSDNLIDREVILAQRDRAYQLERKRFRDDKKEPDVDKDYSGASEVMPNGNDSIDAGQVVNTSSRNEEEQESPVPPVRWKHLQRKRLSRSAEDGGTGSNNVRDSNEETSETYPNLNGDDNRGGTPELDVNANGVDVVEPLKLDDENVLDKTVQVVDNDNENYVHVDHELCSNNSSIPYQGQSTNGNESEAGNGVVCVSPLSNDDQGGSDDDVFEDCVDNREINSFHRTNIGEEDTGMPAVRGTVTAGRPSRKWASDVSSAKSKDAIETAKKKKVTSSKSFSGGKFLSFSLSNYGNLIFNCKEALLTDQSDEMKTLVYNIQNNPVKV